MSIQVGPQGAAIVSRYIVSTTADSGYYTSIQDAIDQAVSDGASASTPANIYIKEGNYTEDLSVGDGIILTGVFNQGSDSQGIINYYPATQITGTITTTGTSPLIRFHQLYLTPTSGNDSFTVTNTGGVIVLNGIRSEAAGGSIAFNITDTTSTHTIRCSECRFVNNQLLNSGSGLTLSFSNCNVNSSIASTIDSATGNYSFQWNFCNIAMNLTAANNTYSVNINPRYCFLSHPNITTGANVTLNYHAFFSLVGFAASGLSISNSSSAMRFENCNLTRSISASTTDTFDYVILGSNTGLINSNTLKSHDNYRGSAAESATTAIQTTDATVTTLVSITLNELESITLKGTITAAQSDHSNMVGGSYEIQARRASGGNVTLVGSPKINVNSSSGATFDCDVNTVTQTVRVRITGVAATTYNWVTQYTYQKVLTEA